MEWLYAIDMYREAAASSEGQAGQAAQILRFASNFGPCQLSELFGDEVDDVVLDARVKAQHRLVDDRVADGKIQLDAQNSQPGGNYLLIAILMVEL